MYIVVCRGVRLQYEMIKCVLLLDNGAVRERLQGRLFSLHYLSILFWGFFIIHLFCIVWREGQGRYELLTMVGAGGTRTCVHPHVSRQLYHCTTDADSILLLGEE